MPGDEHWAAGDEADDEERTAQTDAGHRDQLMQLQVAKEETWLTRLDAMAYEMFGDFYDERRDHFDTIEHLLKQAHLPIDTDLYLSRMTLLTVAGGVVGYLLLLPLLLGLGAMGMFSGTLPLPAPFGSMFVIVGLLVVVGLLFLAVGWGATYLNLSFRAKSRKRRIDRTTPHAVTFMYALSRGGMNFVQVLDTLSDADDAYGEVAVEMESILRDMEYLSVDLPRALRRGAQRTPSTTLAEFLDDLVSVIDSGANLTNFLKDKSDEMLEKAERDQQNFLQTLALLGEVYVTAFVAGPLFLIIITVVMAMLGGGAITQLYGIVYGLLPLMNLVFFLLIDTITMDEGDLETTIHTDREYKSAEEIEQKYSKYAEEDNQVETVIEAKKYRERSEFLRQPISWMLDNPMRTAAVTGPVALVYLVLMFATGMVPATMEAMTTEPTITTAAYVIMPIMIMAVPLSIFYEISARRRKKLLNRLPDALKQLASSNEIGMTLTEALNTVAENTTGVLGEELEKVGNDIKWHHDINEALVAFANRVRLPVVTRTVKLITEANQSTGDIADVLSVAAKDVGKRQMLKKERGQEMMMYTVVVLISYGVYLFVIAMLDSAFLSEIAKLGAENASDAQGPGGQGPGAGGAGGGGGGMGGGLGQLGDLPIEKFRMVFYHSTIIQALGSGLLAGQLGKNEVLAGLKYSILLMLVSTAVFTFM